VTPERGIRALSIVATLLGAARADAQLSIQAHLGDVTVDGFVVACETQAKAKVTLEVSRGNAAYVLMESSEGQRHRLHAHGLGPHERVHWRLSCDGKVTVEGNAQTAPSDDTTALDFLVYGDSRDGEGDERMVVEAMLGGQTAFVLHTGDIVPTGDDEGAWTRLFEVEQPLLTEVPLYLAIGNHERYRDLEVDHARRYLALPGEHTYYTFRVGPARVIALDSNRVDAEQTAWLARTLAEAAIEKGHPHVFVFMHHPPFSTGGHCGSAVEQTDWVALFERYRPTAVFAGHDHAYERLERNGVRYFVTGGAGAPLYAEREVCPDHDRQARRVYVAEHHFLRVRLRGEAVEVEVARPSGPPIEVLRWARGDSFAGTAPALVDERKPTGMLRPMIATLAVSALVVLAIWIARRRPTSGSRTSAD
jgi:hypothetical protein